MSATLYDNAIVKKFRSWTGDNKITISPPEELFSYRAHINTDELKLPLISLNRIGVTLINTQKQPLSYDGMTMVITEDNTVFKLRAIPFRINYQVDVLARTLAECDALVRELIFKIINNPSIEVQIPFNGKKGVHKFNILLGEEIEDNSDITTRDERGEYFRQTLSLYTDDAYLFSYKEHSTKTLDVIVSTDVDIQADISAEINIKEN